MKVPTADQREARFSADYRRVHFQFSSSEPFSSSSSSDLPVSRGHASRRHGSDRRGVLIRRGPFAVTPRGTRCDAKNASACFPKTLPVRLFDAVSARPMSESAVRTLTRRDDAAMERRRRCRSRGAASDQFALASRTAGPSRPNRSKRAWMPAETHTFTSLPGTLLNPPWPASSCERNVVRPTPT